MNLRFLMDTDNELERFKADFDNENGLIDIDEKTLDALGAIEVTVGVPDNLEEARARELLSRATAKLLALGPAFESRILVDEASELAHRELEPLLDEFEREIKRLFNICLRASREPGAKPLSSNDQVPPKYLANQAVSKPLDVDDIVFCLCEMNFGGYFAQLFMDFKFQDDVIGFMKDADAYDRPDKLMSYLKERTPQTGYGLYFEPDDLPTLEQEHEFIRELRNKTVHHHPIPYNDLLKARSVLQQSIDEMKATVDRVLSSAESFDGEGFRSYVDDNYRSMADALANFGSYDLDGISSMVAEATKNINLSGLQEIASAAMPYKKMADTFKQIAELDIVQNLGQRIRDDISESPILDMFNKDFAETTEKTFNENFQKIAGNIAEKVVLDEKARIALHDAATAAMRVRMMDHSTIQKAFAAWRDSMVDGVGINQQYLANLYASVGIDAEFLTELSDMIATFKATGIMGMKSEPEQK